MRADWGLVRTTDELSMDCIPDRGVSGDLGMSNQERPDALQKLKPRAAGRVVKSSSALVAEFECLNEEPRNAKGPPLEGADLEAKLRD